MPPDNVRGPWFLAFSGGMVGEWWLALGWVGLGVVDFLGGGVVFGIGAMVVFFGWHISHYAITRAGSEWPYPNNLSRKITQIIIFMSNYTIPR